MNFGVFVVAVAALYNGAAVAFFFSGDLFVQHGSRQESAIHLYEATRPPQCDVGKPAGLCDAVYTWRGEAVSTQMTAR